MNLLKHTIKAHKSSKQSIVDITHDWIVDIAAARQNTSDKNSSSSEYTPLRVQRLSTSCDYAAWKRLSDSPRRRLSNLEYPHLPHETSSPLTDNPLTDTVFTVSHGSPRTMDSITPATPEDDVFEQVDDVEEVEEVEEVAEELVDEYVDSDEVSDTMVVEEVVTVEIQLNHCTNTLQRMMTCCTLKNDQGAQTLKELIISQKCVDIDIYRNKKKNNCTLLHEAARSNNVECMQVLINFGSNIHVQDAILATPLHYACSSGAKESAAFLLKLGANVNAKDHYEAFPMLIAMKNNHLEVMDILRLCDADVHLKTKRGDSCLHIAARSGLRKRVQYLMEKCEASVSRLNTNHEHVLFASLSNYSVTSFICETLNYKALCKLVSGYNSSGRTVFHEACDNGYLEALLVIVQSIYHKGKKEDSAQLAEQFLTEQFNSYDKAKGYAPLHFAVAKQHAKIVKYLSLCSQVDVNKKDLMNGNTALHLAVLSKRVDIVDIIITMGKADVSIRNNHKESCRRMIERIGGTSADLLVQKPSRSFNTVIQKASSFESMKKLKKSFLNRSFTVVPEPC
jgi:ankyrin repeat protein